MTLKAAASKSVPAPVGVRRNARHENLVVTPKGATVNVLRRRRGEDEGEYGNPTANEGPGEIAGRWGECAAVWHGVVALRA